MGCKRYDGCIICGLFQISSQLQTQIVKNRILSDSLLGKKLYIECIVYSHTYGLTNTVKPVLSGHSKIDKTKVLKPFGS